MQLFGRILAVSGFALALLMGCSGNPPIIAEAGGESGSISIKLVADAQSNFSAVASTAEVVITAEGMKTITKPLTVSGSGISGSVTGIPAGAARKFEVFVYDIANKVVYYGSAVSSVTAGGTANVAMTLYESAGEGNATITGTIQSGNIPPVVTLTSPANNAQFTTGAAIQLEATASDADGSISNVRFFNGATLLGSDASSPFTYTIASASAGTYTLTAVATDNAGASTTSSPVMVTVTAPSSPTYRINAGGSAASPFTADQYFSGGQTSSTTSAITTSGITDPAPQAVYKTERYGAITYTMPNLTNGGSYNVRLHFAELYWTASGKRKFNVSINGTQVLSNFDIYAVAGAGKKAVLREFPVTANGSGQIQIVFTTVTDNAQVCGIEVIPNQPQTYTVTYNGNGNTAGTAPAAGTYTSGSTVTVASPGTLVKTNFTFGGWNTTADGSGTLYAAGATFTMGATNVILYAKWTQQDITPPTITLSGANPVVMLLGTSFAEPGYSASDDKDGNITGSVTVTGAPNSSTPVGRYTVTYKVSDQAGNKATDQKRIVCVEGWVQIPTILTTNDQGFRTAIGSNEELYILHDSQLDKLQGTTFTTLPALPFQYGTVRMSRDGTTPYYLTSEWPTGSQLYSFNGSSWSAMGARLVWDALNPPLAVGPGGMFLSATDGISIMQYSSNGWTALGGTLSDVAPQTNNGWNDKYITITDNSTPYIIGTGSFSLACDKYNGSNWVAATGGSDNSLGSSGYPTNIQIVSDANTVYAGYTDNQPFVYRLDGSSWTTLQSLGYNAGMGFGMTTSSDHFCYVAYNDGSSIMVGKYNSSSTTADYVPSVGTRTAFSGPSCQHLSIEAGPNVCYVIYQQGTDKIIVWQWHKQ